MNGTPSQVVETEATEGGPEATVVEVKPVAVAGRTAAIDRGRPVVDRRHGIRSEKPSAVTIAAPADAMGHRRDIEGLRAVAVSLVVLYHISCPVITGGYVGVDVFFVISGFLITTKLLEELSRRGTISITRFYARRITRLLPAATLTTVAVLVTTWYWLPLRIASTSADGRSAAYYGVNFRLARASVDYFGAATPSPLQHYWSLAVEEQFYLVWPVLLLATSLAWCKRRAIRRILTVPALGALTAGSFLICYWQTGHAMSWAYFGTAARVWELASGALVAVLWPYTDRIPRSVAALMTWVGLAAIGASAVLFDDRTAFPGTAALLPVLGSAAVIGGGRAASATSATVLLGRPVLQWIGARSYSWYLWHWPVIVIAPAMIGNPLSLPGTLALAAASLVIAALAYRLVEDPTRRNVPLRATPRNAISLGIALSALAAAVASATAQVPTRLVGRGAPVNVAGMMATASDPSATLTRLLARSTNTRTVPANLTPSLRHAESDRPVLYRNGCYPRAVDIEPKRSCVFGDTTSSTNVVLFGDSHAAHWLPALDIVAKRQHWRLHVFAKTSCSAAEAMIYMQAFRRPYLECAQWRARSFEKITVLGPAMVLMSSTDAYDAPLGAKGGGDQAWVDAWRNSIRRLKVATRTVILIRDTPRLPENMLDCVAAHLADVRACGRSKAHSIASPHRRQMIAAMAASEGTKVIDPLSWFCTSMTCPAIVGNVLVYRDGQHMSTFYSTLLAPLVERQLT